MAVYLDYNATTPIDPRVARAMAPFIDRHFGNPGSAHAFGLPAREAVDKARASVARLINASPRQVVFMSCATETINFVVRGIAAERRVRGQGAHIVTTTVEHVAVLEAAKYAETYENASISYVGVHSDGTVRMDELEAALRDDTALVSCMLANNEVGSLNDVRAVVERVRRLAPRAAVHCDASQGVAKVDVDAAYLGVDFLTVAGHKLYAPKGVAALYCRDPDRRLPGLLVGGGQEGGRRAGTENVILAVALGRACDLAAAELAEESARLTALRERLLRELVARVRGPHVVHGPHEPHHRLPTTLSIAFPGVRAADIVSVLGHDVAFSAGAACHAEGPPRVSHVLAAMAVSDEVALGTMRLSVGRFTTEEEITRAAEMIANEVNARRGGTEAAGEGARASASAAAAAGAAAAATRRLYLGDSYLYFADVRVVAAREGPEPGQVTLVTDATVFHPQGGGQPSDTGHIYLPREHASVPALLCVHKARAVDGGVVEHICDVEIQDETPETDALTAGRVVALLPQGATVHQRVDEAGRRLHARLHSAGHLLDRAMELAGETLVPGKGYHFPGRPYVEYEGAVPPERRDALAERLNDVCRRLVEENAATQVLEVTSAAEVARLCGTDCSVDHLAEGQPIRVVVVAGKGCPCGGTHVARAGEVGALRVTGIKVKKGRTQVKYELSGP